MESEFNTFGLKRDIAGYKTLGEQIDSLLTGETDMIANLANVSAVIHAFGQFHWVGFYLVKENELVLGPFQGPVACTRIAYGKGACGKSWKEDRTILLENVHEFADHIACSPYSNSEIVIPFHKGNEIAGVFDIDSVHLNDFSETDRTGLESIVQILEKHL